MQHRLFFDSIESVVADLFIHALADVQSSHVRAGLRLWQFMVSYRALHADDCCVQHIQSH